MGIDVEEEWRYKKRGESSEKKSSRASKSAFAYKVNKQKKARGDHSKGGTIILGSQEVIVKFTAGAKTKKGINKAIQYISRDCEIGLVDCNGITHKSKEDIEEVVKIIQENVILSEKEVELTKSLTFSPPRVACVSREHALEAVKQAILEKYPDNYFVLGYHCDTKNDHIHVVMNVNKYNGERIQISGRDFKEMRQRFASNLIEYGYDVKATIKHKYPNPEWQELASRENINEYEVVEYGSSAYQLNKQNSKNNYLIYRTIKSGKEVTIWGKEILNEIKRNDVKAGDRIRLKKIGEVKVKVPVYSKDGGSIISWKSAQKNQWQIENLSRQVYIKHEEAPKLSEIRLEGEERMKMQLEARENFVHEKKMLLDKDYKQKYEQEKKLNIKHKPEFKF